MKRTVLIIALIVVTIGFTTYGFVNTKHDTTNDKQRASSSNIKTSSTDFFEFESLDKKMAFNNQDLFYVVKRRYDQSITKESLKNVKLISDVIANYPENWISEYVSVELITKTNGKEISAVSADDVLSKEQRNLLNTLVESSSIIINVKYKTKVAVTNVMENNLLNISMTIIPEKEAEFVGGYDKMIAYLQKNIKGEFSNEILSQLQFSSVVFTVNKQGQTDNIKLINTTGNSEIDKLLLKLIGNMPKWAPAKNSMGGLVKQDFEFNFGNANC